MATSSVTANFEISGLETVQVFTDAFSRNKRTTATPLEMTWHKITIAEIDRL